MLKLELFGLPGLNAAAMISDAAQCARSSPLFERESARRGLGYCVSHSIISPADWLTGGPDPPRLRVAASFWPCSDAGCLIRRVLAQLALSDAAPRISAR